MYISDNFKVNSCGHLEIGGCDTTTLAKEYKTPLYVLDEQRVRTAMRAYKNAIDKYYGGRGLVLYASKALCAGYIYKIVSEEGLGADVVSGGEIYTAIKAGFDPSKIYFHGNNKSADEIEMAVENKIGVFVADSFLELEMLSAAAKRHGTVANVMLRIKPGVEAHTHEFIKTGQIDSKFGFAVENGEAMQAAKTAASLDGVRLMGVHCHIGSQIFDLEPFTLAAKIMMDFCAEIKAETGVEIEQLNLGGGFGISYTDEDEPIEYGKYIEAVSETLKKECAEKGLSLPFILMEPGRSIVGDAGATLYTVGNIKNIEGIRKYVAVDGGMGDNPRYILYGAKHDGVIANRAAETELEKVTVCGKCCESGDVIMENVMLQKAQPGDILAVMATGAYNYSMASNYNRIPRPPVIAVKDGKSKVIVKRETYEDIIKNDIF